MPLTKCSNIEKECISQGTKWSQKGSFIRYIKLKISSYAQSKLNLHLWTNDLKISKDHMEIYVLFVYQVWCCQANGSQNIELIIHVYSIVQSK